jgi:putative FmdB family regulatory protein
LPLYEYGCPSCGLVTDVRHGFDEKPEVTCEKCGTRLVRRFSAAPIVFKGSGFYVTDSRSKSSSSGDGEKSEPKKSEPPATSAPTSPSAGGEKSGGEKSGGEKSGGEKKSGEAAA